MARRRTELDFPSVKIEGALFPGDFLARIAHFGAPEQSESDYRIPKKLRLRDELGRYFRIAEGLWQDFQSAPVGKGRDARKITVEGFLLPFLRQVLGFEDVVPVGIMEHGGRRFPIGHAATGGRVPLILAARDEELDEPTERYGDDHRRRSPFLLAQEYLNAGAALWAIVSNGKVLRVLRDNPSLTRPAYLEFDLERLFEERLYPDFAVLWLACHASRFGAASAAASDCALERWKSVAQQEGTRARERLRFGVADALRELGTGFLAVPGNAALRARIEKGELSSEAFYQQLLRLIYRLLFLFTGEERGLIHPPNASKEAADLYRDGYSLAQLRALAARRRRFDRHYDLWQGLLVAFAGLAKGEPVLALPGLGGLFRARECPDLDTSDLPNRSLLEAIYGLAYFVEDGALVRVNYRDMGSEELGSIYEALLELVPEIDTSSHPWRFRFVGDDAPGDASVAGNARKLTGSYYTPDSLVQELIKSTLEPVIAERLRGAEDAEKALLSIRVLDPACGSGHFLLAAARKLAEYLAKSRVIGTEPRPEDYRRALRDVVSQCVFGVDRNPLALELARTAIWLESFSPDRPLGFLDHHLRCGDALIGVLDPHVMAEGIPDEALKPLSGDDKEVARLLMKKNVTARKELTREKERLSVMQELTVYEAEGGKVLDSMPEDSIDDVDAKREAFERAHLANEGSKPLRLADCFVAAFFCVKAKNTAAVAPTTEDLHRIMRDVSPRDGVSESVRRVARNAHAFHWRLEFPGVFQGGQGFDVLLGNPPWERIKLHEEEFFATRSPEIAAAGNKAARTRLIEKLAEGNSVERALHASFISAKRISEAASTYAHSSGRYPLTGVGDTNTYALFAETFTALLNGRGRAGFIVPTGIATDNSTKAFFDMLMSGKRLATLLSFENEEFVFPGVHHSYRFCLLTITGPELPSDAAELVFYARQSEDIHDQRRRFALSSDEIALLNPNSRTCPTFRSKADAELTLKLYGNIPVLVNESREDGDPWGMRFMRMFDMSTDSSLFIREKRHDRLPLYEAKMIEQYDHRAGSYETRENERGFRVLPATSMESYQNPGYSITPYYWVERSEVQERLADKWSRAWFVGYKDVTSAVAYRTFIATVLPLSGVGNTLHLLLPSVTDVRLIACLLGNCNSLVVDYVARQKIGYIHMTYNYVKQLPIIPPHQYGAEEIDFIVPRVLELTYVANDLRPWAEDLGYQGRPFVWDSLRRAGLRAELDAFFARLYGMTRDELRYVIDPADVAGREYPSETFRVLKEQEIREFGEFRSGRLVLEAWDRLEQGRIATPRPTALRPGKPSVDVLPMGAWARPMADERAESGAVLGAILKAMTGPLPARQVRLTATLALQPRLLHAFLTADEAATWRRLVGPEADALPRGTSSIVPRVDGAWGAAVRTLRTNGSLVEETRSGTWASGANLDALETAGWPDGRARFVLTVLERQSTESIVRELPAPLRDWIDAQAA